MKTGRDVWERALRLLNYTDGNGCLDGRQYAELYKRALPTVNQIYCDLWYASANGAFRELSRLDDRLQLPARAVEDVAPYGVAMLIAQAESDGDSGQLFAALYNQKRSVLGRGTTRVDVMPTVRAGCGE